MFIILKMWAKFQVSQMILGRVHLQLSQTKSIDVHHHHQLSNN